MAAKAGSDGGNPPRERCASVLRQNLHHERADRVAQPRAQELRTLGKGGFGLVVAAVNRLDGRQYAVKKIRMPVGVPSGRSRLMREVATLARLQAPNVVRYFQAGPLCIRRHSGLECCERSQDGRRLYHAPGLALCG